ncbi:alcohol dehydrogenase, iron-containing family protein [Histomonas meleagridis]|uniref:alcohol dehydrogenase, iron-containing family protein n=1 Tax=Histomonas meleagridis TaxID=135588 RepID=UPI0035597C3F|nr:alcohol dehydrogenase, iron-containing family protein [Histomonas meleagridis]KAH0800939.1 alcohol dehydrogenase, iron-containing family protein [Histomonas meleagridis]
MSQHWLWNNTTQVAFGTGCVKEYMPKFVKSNSKILCTFGGGSIDHNGARKDVTEALAELKCEVRWEGGIPPNPEYDRLVEIVKVVKEFKPDLILAVGGGSVLDGTKFISLASKLDDKEDPWGILMGSVKPTEAYPVASVMTIPATGSEWNSGFVVSRRSIHAKAAGFSQMTYPKFSLLDPQYTMTLPVRQLRNGVYDAACHIIDQLMTPAENPLMDHFLMSVLKELVDIGADVVKENSSIELHERLIIAASFALNNILVLGKEQCWAIHMIGHQLTVEYGIDHGATLAIVTPFLLENQFEQRKSIMAKTGEFVFGCQGTEEEKARGCIAGIRKFIKDIGQATKVTDWEGAKIKDGDLDKVTKMVMASVGGKPFGFRGSIGEKETKEILSHCIV